MFLAPFGPTWSIVGPFWRPLDFEGVPNSTFSLKINKNYEKNYIQEGGLEKISFAPSDEMQATVYAMLRKAAFKKSATDVIADRLMYWLPDMTKGKIMRSIRRFAFIAKKLPPCIATVVLKSFTNCWCTSARFHDNRLPCRMCAAVGKDDIRHYIECPRVWHALHDNSHKLQQLWGLPECPMAGLLLLGTLKKQEQLLRIALAHDAIYTILNTLRVRDQIGADQEQISAGMKARLRQQAIRDARARAAIQCLL